MMVHYKNGNYTVALNLEDGTKIRFTHDANFKPTRPESMDVKITDQCTHNCVMCHENSNINGKLASKDAMKKFVNTIPAYTEIAVGGGNIMDSYNHTEMFLKMLKKVSAVPSITVRQDDFLKYEYIIRSWIKKKLIYGIGISYMGVTSDEFFETVAKYPTAVLHVIAGMLTEEDYQKIRKHNLKMLILGYKVKGRGAKFWDKQSNQISQNVVDLMAHFDEFKEDFNTVAFDNLALEQLDIKNYISEEDWRCYYLGDDGQYTFYVDLVNEQFARSSTEQRRIDMYPNTYSVQQMFDIVRGVEILKKIRSEERYDSI